MDSEKDAQEIDDKDFLSLCFDYQNSPALLLEHIEEIKQVRDKCLKQLQFPNSESINGAQVYKGLDMLRHSIEENIKLIAQNLPSTTWLYYLRRLPIFCFDAGNRSVPLKPMIASSIAEAFSAMSKEKSLLPQSTDQFYLHIEPESVQKFKQLIFNYCGNILALRVVHTQMRTASKGVCFKNHNNVLIPIPTPSQLAAMKLYDKENKQFRFSGLGTLLDVTPDSSAINDDVILLIDKKLYKEKINIYKSNSSSKTTESQLALEEQRKNLTSTKFTMSPYKIPNLQKFSKLSKQNCSNAFISLIALIVTTKMIVSNEKSEYVKKQILLRGYILDDKKKFTKRIEESMQEWASKIAAFLNIDEQQLNSFNKDIYSKLEECGKLWPVHHSPILRTNGTRVLCDLYAASECLSYALTSEIVVGNIANDRGKHFENQVQALVDQTEWRPSDKLNKIRNQKQIRRPNGTHITDIDAIAFKDGKLIVVSCKSQLVSDQTVTGDYCFIKSKAIALYKALEKAEKDSSYLNEFKKNSKGSYDFSNANIIVFVVCTPNRVYYEEELVGCKLPKPKYKLNNLPSALTPLELETWLKEN